MKKFAVLLFLGLALSGCSVFRGFARPTPTIVPSDSPTALPSQTPTATPLPPTQTPTATATITLIPTPAYPKEGYGPQNFPTDVNPLTGLQVGDPATLNRRPVAIKVNIVPRTSTRPPWGLSLADIVYEFYQNDGYTRFHSIFLGNEATEVGPIRSARLPDDSLIRMYKSIFAYGSADPTINARLLNADYYNRLVLEGGRRSLCPPTDEAPLCRFDPNGYDLLLGGTSEIRAFAATQGVDDVRQNLDGMFFQLEAPPGGQSAKQAAVRYSGDSYTRWEYDPQTGQYLRLQDNVFDTGQGEDYVPLMDRVNEEQITANNIVVLVMPHSFFRKPPSEIVDIQFVGSGIAYAFRDGQVYELQWSIPDTESIPALTFPDGSPYPMKPGNTWYQIVGTTSVVTQPEADAWRFEFNF